MEDIKLVTFNIRCDYGQDGINNFNFRAPLITDKINTEKPDIICFQEVLPHIASWLKTAFADYYIIGCGRSADFADEQEAIAFKKDRFNLVNMSTFWMSETPNIPGSRYEKQFFYNLSALFIYIKLYIIISLTIFNTLFICFATINVFHNNLADLTIFIKCPVYWI